MFEITDNLWLWIMVIRILSTATTTTNSTRKRNSRKLDQGVPRENEHFIFNWKIFQVKKKIPME